MTILMVLDKLKSRVTRAPIGIRQFTTKTALSLATPGSSKLKLFGLGLYGLGGFIVAETIQALLAGILLNFTSLWTGVVRSVNFLWNFNWNESDEDLNKLVESHLKSLAFHAGTALGQFIGYAVCGVLPTAQMYTFNESLALYVFKRFGEQAVNNLALELAVLIRLSFIIAVQASAAMIYVNIRHLMRPSNEEFRKQLIAKGITNQSQIDKAIEQRNKPWSFAKSFNESVSKIPNHFVQELVKGTALGVSMGCIHAGYIIAGALDSYIADNRIRADEELGLEETVEILLGKRTTKTSGLSAPAF